MQTIESDNTRPFTVASYLKARLEELGLERLFGVAGNYTAPFLDTILEDASSPIVISGISNEICAGYAADGYARLRGIGAVAVTYGVGAFSLLNAAAGSFVEHAPVVIINGAPTNKEFQNERRTGLLYSHMMSDPLSNLDVFRNVTVAAERISNANEAPYQIDAALTACITVGRPVYLEVLEDVWRAECQRPGPKLTRKPSSMARSSVKEAVDATMLLLEASEKPVIWAGHEIQREGLQQQFLQFVEGTDWSFTTTVLGKSIVAETHPRFVGVYSPSAPNEDDVQEFINGADCLIGLGAWTTGKDTGNQLINGSQVVLAANGGVTVGPRFFPVVPLGEFMRVLLEQWASLQAKKAAYRFVRRLGKRALAAEAPGPVTYDSFFKQLNDFIQKAHDAQKDHVVVCDAGFPLPAAQNGLKIPIANGFVAQASWLAIGYSTPAAIGVKCAMPNHRVLVVVGDGAFQETCQAVSSHHHLQQNTVVFVLANGIYAIEQKLVNPNPFRQPPRDYSDPLLDKVYSYNKLHDWSYEKLADVFGGKGIVVNTLQELADALQTIDQHPDDNFVVVVRIPETDTPASVKKSLNDPGEDETPNSQWPPALLF
jgi:indolepyruvate decarboxylase